MDIIDQVRQAANIIEIASQYTNLAQKGRRHVGLCPFHTEKSPSFFVDEEKQLFHCFGCGAGGDIFTLIMEKENLSFPEALRHLAEHYSIPIPEQKKFSPQMQSLKENIYKITEDTLAFYRKNLFNTSEGKKAQQYLEKRGITPPTIQTLKIGYALNSWDSLLSFFTKKKTSPGLLEKAGLVLRRQDKDGYYDRFRGRIIFPIFDDRSGKVVAFGGRTLINEEPKYLNSPNTPIYSKGNLLYGLNLTRDAIREKGELILVEGYTDFLALFQAGIENVSASLGTSLTPHQIDLARRRSSSRIIAAYDGDIAGRKAAYRTVSLCFEQGAEIRVLNLPSKFDPDSYIKKYGPEKFKALVEQSVSGLDFLVHSQTQGKSPGSPEEKARIARIIFNEIKKIPDSILQSEYLKRMSELLAVEEQDLRAIATRQKYVTKGSKSIHFLHAEKRLLQIIFQDGQIATSLFKDITEQDYEDLKSKPIFVLLTAFFKEGKKPSFAQMREKIDSQLFSALSEILLEKTPPATLEEAMDCLSSIRQFALSQVLRNLKSEISSLKKKGEQDKIPPILSKIMDINKHLYELSQRNM
jgi:DNA primase